MKNRWKLWPFSLEKSIYNYRIHFEYKFSERTRTQVSRLKNSFSRGNLFFRTITKYLIYKLISVYLRHSIYFFCSIEELELHCKFYLIHKLFISTLQNKTLSASKTHYWCSFYLISTFNYRELSRRSQVITLEIYNLTEQPLQFNT